MNSEILKLKDKYIQGAIKLRHKLHENPELSSQEYKTSKLLKEYAKKLGLEIIEVSPDERSSGTGFIAILDTNKPGKTIGLRTDIDALPVLENKKNLIQERSVISKVDNIMHACGHDGHMATLIYTMHILNDLKDKLKGRIIFIFEEAEEVGNGINAMIKLLETQNIDAIYGNHLLSSLDVGKISVDEGPVMAASSFIDFTIIGKGGHGSRPDLSINPLFAGVDILNSISVAWNNQINVEETVTLGITQFHTGQQNNVFDDKATIGGTLRYFNIKEGEKAYKLLMDIVHNVAAIHKCRIEVSKLSGPATIPVINDATLAALGKSCVNELFEDALVENTKWFASESFAHYSKIAPSLFTFIGIKNDELGSGAEHHNEYFDMDDKALDYSIALMSKFTVEYLLNN